MKSFWIATEISFIIINFIIIDISSSYINIIIVVIIILVSIIINITTCLYILLVNMGAVSGGGPKGNKSLTDLRFIPAICDLKISLFISLRKLCFFNDGNSLRSIVNFKNSLTTENTHIQRYI